MKVITRQEVANHVADKWKKQYETGPYASPEKVAKLIALRALGDTPNPDDVDKAIGNESWTRVKCHECNEEVSPVIRVGQKPDYESYTACICLRCLHIAVEILGSR